MNKVNSVDKSLFGADTQTGCVVVDDIFKAAQTKTATIVLVNSVVAQIKVVEMPDFWIGDNGVKYDKMCGRYIEGETMSRLILASIK